MDITQHTSTLSSPVKVRPHDPEAFAGLVELWDIGVTTEQMVAATNVVTAHVTDPDARQLILETLGLS